MVKISGHPVEYQIKAKIEYLVFSQLAEGVLFLQVLLVEHRKKFQDKFADS